MSVVSDIIINIIVTIIIIMTIIMNIIITRRAQQSNFIYVSTKGWCFPHLWISTQKELL